MAAKQTAPIKPRPPQTSPGPETSVRKFRITASDGKSYLTNHYNLDAILSVGYRVNSKRATKFRQWATQTLKQHITAEYRINPARIEQNQRAFLAAVEDLRRRSAGSQAMGPGDLFSLVAAFAQTWFSLKAYDEEQLPCQGKCLTTIPLEAEELYRAVEVFEAELVQKNHATALFAQEKTQGALSGILGSVFQSAFG
ncbi:MAG: RhuM family protein [bacterium]|nr:RhuM family protein [bacterium]